MHFTSVALFATSVLAAGPFRGGPRGNCLSESETADLVNAYRNLIANYDDDTADKYLADDFVEYSDSINAFAGIPLGGPTFPSKDIFKQTQAQSPAYPLEIEKVYGSCSTISVTWTATFGADAKSARGITIIDADKEQDEEGNSSWKISKLDVEFNSLVWLANEGGSYILPVRPSS